MPIAPDVVHGVWDVPSGTVRGTLRDQAYDRRILKISFAGLPQGTTFALYKGYIVDDAFLQTTTLLGSRNSYDAGLNSAPMTIFAGEAMTFVWSGNGLSAASTVTATVLSQWGE